MDEIIKILKTLGIPYAYDHFAEGEGPDPPFICYRCPNSDNFAADGTVYFPITEIDIELYTDRKGSGDREETGRPADRKRDLL
jgi:hypothetical protein